MLVVLSLIGFSEVKKRQSATNEYRIGAALALTGDAALWGAASLKAAELAIQETNEDGGIQR